MKNLIVLISIFFFNILSAQDAKPKFEKQGELVKATYFYKNGNVRQEGFFNGKKLTGTWVSYNEKGFKTAIANYSNGKKEGKWLVSSSKGIKEVTFKDSKIVGVNSTNVALN